MWAELQGLVAAAAVGQHSCALGGALFAETLCTAWVQQCRDADVLQEQHQGHSPVPAAPATQLALARPVPKRQAHPQ